MRVGGPLRGALALVVLLLVVAGAGRVVGVGPLAGTVPPDQVTDPGEMIARSLQAMLDAASVHVDGTLEGTLPGALLERDEASVDLAGTTITADLRPRDARTQAHVTSSTLGVDLEAITVWTDAWYRSAGAPWQKVPVSEATSGTGVDINPLTLVDRMRSYLATSGRTPTVTDVTCGSASGRCHEVRLDAGTDPAGVLVAMLPGATDGSAVMRHLRAGGGTRRRGPVWRFPAGRRRRPRLPRRRAAAGARAQAGAARSRSHDWDPR